MTSRSITARGVLFDLDETLIDRSASIRSYADKFWRIHAEQIDMSRPIFVERFVSLDGNGYVPRQEFFASLADEIAHPAIGADRIEGHYFETIWEAPIVMAGAKQGLQALRAEGVPIGVVTNGGTRNQRGKLENTGLARLMDGCYISEAVGAKKPDPQIFTAACEGLGIEPTCSWFVGDHPLLDVCGSHSLGFRSIWIRRAIPWPESREACYVFAADELSDAMDYLLDAIGAPVSATEDA